MVNDHGQLAESRQGAIPKLGRECGAKIISVANDRRGSGLETLSARLKPCPSRSWFLPPFENREG